MKNAVKGMADKMHLEAEYDPVLILEGLQATDHRELVTHLSNARSYIRNALPSDKHVDGIAEIVIELAKHPKWEVKLAVAEVLGCVDLRKVRKTLEMLSKEPVRYVQNAAKKALRDSKRITTRISEKRDPTADRLFALIEKMNPRNVREAYAAAMQVGQIYYRELAGITAHELRTSLFYISSMIKELLREKCFKEDALCEEYVSKIRTGIEDLQEMLSRLKDLTSEPQNNEVFEVVPIIEQSIEEARGNAVDSRSDFKGIQSHGLWGDTKLQGDPVQLKMALRNLIINAIEASRADQSVSVSLQLSENTLHIVIQDEGIGMTDQDIISAFKPFSSLKDTGRGFGVPIAQRIIHFDFGGEIRYESEVGKGTKVFIEFPVYSEAAE